jgi:hypothetical protein
VNTPILVHNTCGGGLEFLRGDQLGSFKPLHGTDPEKMAEMRNWSNEDLINSIK